MTVTHASIADIPIPREDWRQFCAAFSRQHQDWLVRVRRLATRAGDNGLEETSKTQALFEGYRPLKALRDTGGNGHPALEITVGEDPEVMSFLLHDAVALYTRRRQSRHVGLRLDTANGRSTLIEFRTAADPAALDGPAIAQG